MKDPQTMEKNVIYPQGWTESVKDPTAKETRYQEVKDDLKARVKALVKTNPMPYDKVFLELGKAGAPGGTYGWMRAIQDVDAEWHPTKFEASVESIETPVEK